MAGLAGTAAATALLAGALVGPAQAASPEVIAQFKPGVTPAQAYAAVAAAGGQVTRDLHIINGLGVVAGPAARRQLAGDEAVSQITDNTGVKSSATTLVETSRLADSYTASVFADKLWNGKLLTGKGVGVAVIDTGIAGDLPDFRVSGDRPDIASDRLRGHEPRGDDAGDAYGHGTHIAGLVAGNGTNRARERPARRQVRRRGTEREPDLGQGQRRRRQRDRARRDRRPAVRRRPHGRLQHPRRQPLARVLDGRSRTRPTRWTRRSSRHGSTGIVVVAAAGNRGAAERRGLLRAGQRPLRDHGRRRSTTWAPRAPSDDNCHAVVEPRHDPGRVRQARGDRAGRAHRLDDRAGRDYASCARAACATALLPVGGTSMAARCVRRGRCAAPQKHPTWTPNQVKGAVVKSHPAADRRANRPARGRRRHGADGDGPPRTRGSRRTRTSTRRPATSTTSAQAGAGRAGASAADALRASWSRASWSCVCDGFTGASVDPTRASWSRASWSTSWDK